MSLTRPVGAEFIGTFWLVLVGCGSAVLAAGFSRLGIGFTGVALAFGLTLLTRGLISGAAEAAGSLQLTESDSGLKGLAQEMRRAG